MKGQGGSAMRKPPQQPKQDEPTQQAAPGKVDGADQANGAAHTAEPEEEHIERVELTTQSLIGMRTMRGDLATWILNLIKDEFPEWGKFPEWKQKAIINRTNERCAKLVHEAVRLVAADGTEPIPMSFATYTVDAEKGIVCKVAFKRDADTLLAVDAALGKAGYFLPYTAEDYLGEREPILPDTVGDLGIPKEPKDNLVVAGHTIKMEVVEEGETKTSVASCECGWKSDLPVAEVEKQGPLIKAHLEEQRRLEQLGKGKVDEKGNLLKPDVNGEVDKTKTEQMATAGQTMPGDVGPATPETRTAAGDEPIPGPEKEKQPEPAEA